MRVNFLVILSFLFLALQAQNDYTKFVNPLIGTGGHGHTFPGATLPFAMVQLSPDTRIDGSWDGCSGYHYSDSLIYGFSHTHLSGTGCSDYGDISFMPTLVSKPVEPISRIDTLYYSFFHKNEVAKAGYYAVLLNNGIQVELTSTVRTGLQQYTYTQAGYAWITLNLKHRDELLQGKITEINKHTFSGFRRSKAWAEDQLVYYYFELSRDAEQIIFSKNEKGETKVNLGFKVNAGDKILIKTALSSADEEGAKGNMLTELPHWNFEKVKSEANATWNLELNRIKAYGGTTDERTNFYTALYHCMIHPNIMNDVDGRYRGRDRQIHKADGFNYYTVFSLWDTYRALHPLLNIIDKDRSRDFVLTFLAQFEQSGRLPMWELWGNETNCMIGFHSVSVILDAYNKGAIGAEVLNALYNAVKTEAMSTRFGLSEFRKNGFLSIEEESESVSKTLEYSYDMYCVANIAFALHHDMEAEYFRGLAAAWKNVYDLKTGFMRPRKNGGWLTPFDPKQVNNHYTEANSWQYSFAIPQSYEQVYDMAKISELFTTDSKTTGREQSDISGLIGQYAQGNEPSHHIAYLFNNLDSSAKYVRKICEELYHPTPDGLCGNEDCGQMSAWYVFSAMGFYPVNPSTNAMVFGNMLFDSVRFTNNERSSIIYKNKKPEDGSSYFKSNRFELSRLSDINYFGYSNQLAPKEITSLVELSAPIIESVNEVFSEKMRVTISNNNFNNLNSLYPEALTQGSIYFTMDGSIPSQKSTSLYAATDTIEISENTIIKAIYIAAKGPKSAIATARFYKKPNNYAIKIKSIPNKQYTADGEDALLDGRVGDADWRKGRWQGYQGQDFEALIDLKKAKNINSIKLGFLQDTRSWILFPSKVLVYGSEDSVNFVELGSIVNSVSDTDLNSQRKEFVLQTNGKSFQYIKIKAVNYGVLPKWHQGAGGEAFIFIDEIIVE